MMGRGTEGPSPGRVACATLRLVVVAAAGWAWGRGAQAGDGVRDSYLAQPHCHQTVPPMVMVRPLEWQSPTQGGAISQNPSPEWHFPFPFPQHLVFPAVLA